MGIPKTVRFKEVNVGDQVYNSLHFHYPWEKVTEVYLRGNYVTLKVGVSAHPTIDTRTNFVGCPDEAISIIEKEKEEEEHVKRSISKGKRRLQQTPV